MKAKIKLKVSEDGCESESHGKHECEGDDEDKGRKVNVWRLAAALLTGLVTRDQHCCYNLAGSSRQTEAIDTAAHYAAVPCSFLYIARRAIRCTQT